jgi:hypothetical protein
MSDHAHHWRATSKIFALACECGIIYHDWLLGEIDRLRKSAVSSDDAMLREMTLSEELSKARREIENLRAMIDEAKHELETGAAEIADMLG